MSPGSRASYATECPACPASRLGARRAGPARPAPCRFPFGLLGRGGYEASGLKRDCVEARASGGGHHRRADNSRGGRRYVTTRREGTHQLRHHYASVMLASGVNVKELAEYLGTAPSCDQQREARRSCRRTPRVS